MMRLLQIEVFGFKSFADKTKLEFHDGITAIVGPNGCGKSNISDAFRWVLGEKSAKSMRGDKMEDVIFAGTAKRKPLNIAEATLTLSNSDGALNIAYDEVALTRRTYRSGESDYFINRRPVRLKDVQELFMDSGIGKDAFAIFEQGKIDQVINYNPLERRYIFEEAAGIVRFLQRKKEALRKLTQTEANVSRVRDIHKEVEKRIIVLEEQVEKAKRYKEEKALLELLEKALFAAKWDNFQKRKAGAAGQEQQYKEKMQAFLDALKEREKKLYEERIFLTEEERKLRAGSESFYQVKGEKEIFLRENEAVAKRLEELAAEITHKTTELRTLQEKDVSGIEEKKGQQQCLEKLKENFSTLEEQRKKALDTYNGLEEEVAALRACLQNEQKELMERIRQEQQIESELKQYTVRLEGNQSRIQQLQELAQKLASAKLALQSELEEKSSLTIGSQEALEEKRGLLLEKKTLLDQIKGKILQKEEERHHVRRTLAELEAREKVLVRLRNEMEGISSGTKILLKEAAKSGSSLFGKVKGIWQEMSLEPEKGYSTVMLAYAQTLVVASKNDVKDLLAFAAENKIKDFSVLCLEMVDKSLSSHFFDRLAHAATFDEAFEKKCLALCPDGLFIDHNNVIFLASSGEKNTFCREAELKKCEKERKKGEEALATLETEYVSLVSERERMQAENNLFDQTLRQEEMKLVEMNVQLQRLRKDLEHTEQDQSKHVEDMAALEKVGVELKAHLAALKEKHVEAKMQAETMKGQTHERSGKLEALSLSLRKEQLTLREKEGVYQKACDEVRAREHALDMIEVKAFESERQKKRLQEEIAHLSRSRDEYQRKSEEGAGNLAEIQERLEKAKTAVNELEEEVLARKAVLVQIEEGMSVEREEIKTLEAEAHQQQIKIAEIDAARQALETEFFEKFHMTADEARKEAAEIEKSMGDMEREVRMLRKALQEAGDVNMTSIEEYAALKERYEFLNVQLDDLDAAKTELVQIITELDSESRKIFKEVFGMIRENFQKNFKILFNGGESDLQLTESQDILEAGIEILAKPPGKQMRSIQLMSGGEKCLTSIALLFAIFEVKPAPFCILDEIDAPLDDTNVERFLHVVKQFSDKCQFIIITHNKRTMALADRLFGVSMEERGVSKLLAMEFTNEESKEPVLV